MEFKRENLFFYLQQKSLCFLKSLKSFKTRLSCCDLCGGSCQSQAIICNFCLADLPLFDLATLHGDLLTWPAVNKILSKRKFDQLITVAPYQWPINLWVRQLKYHGRFELVNLLSNLIFQQWQNVVKHESETPDSFRPPSLLFSVPIHMKKWQKRGFNQAHLLAENFANKAKIAYCPNALTRTNNDISQAGQTGVIRRKNLRHAFELSADFLVTYSQQPNVLEHVMLLDDVVTTGSTCNEICCLLKNNGVKRITVISLCLSLPDNNNNAQ